VSLPGVTAEVTRPLSVRIAYQDLAGTAHTQAADGFLAVCLQHEIDQLDGIFWTQRLSRLKRDQVMRRFDKLARQGQA
jgi:peptide deformylase